MQFLENSNDILKEIEKVILIFIQKHKRHQLAKALFSKMDVAGATTITQDFKLQYRVTKSGEKRDV